jgi:GTP-binding protein EngB required for normal cell division
MQTFVDKISDAVKESLNIKREISFLLVGRTGVGKSSAINSLFGSEVAPTGRFEPKTKDVKIYKHNHGGRIFNIIDTPGLCDDLPEAGNDDEYIAKMKKTVQSVDSLWYVSELCATRVTSDEKRGIKLLNNAFGKEVWSRSVIIFTFSDRVKRADFAEVLTQRTKLLRAEISKYIGEEALKVPVVAISNVRHRLPNGKKWLGELFTIVLERFSEIGALPFLLSMKEDLHPESKASTVEGEAEAVKPRVELNKDQKDRVRKSTATKIIAAAGAGAKVGSTLGTAYGPIGKAVGAAVGAVVGGFLGWLFG